MIQPESARTFRARHFSYEVSFCEFADAFLDAAASKARYLSYERYGDDFVILGTHLDAPESPEDIAAQISQLSRIELAVERIDQL
jgi:hypothetical protein